MVISFSFSLPALFFTCVFFVSTQTTLSFTSDLCSQEVRSFSQLKTEVKSDTHLKNTHSLMPRSAKVVSRKGNSWFVRSTCIWMGSTTDMGTFQSTLTRTILSCGPGDSLSAGLSDPLLAWSSSSSTNKLFSSSAASLTFSFPPYIPKMENCVVFLHFCPFWINVACWCQQWSAVFSFSGLMIQSSAPTDVEAFWEVSASHRRRSGPPAWYKQLVRMCVMCRSAVRFITLWWWTVGVCVCLSGYVADIRS